MMPNPVADFPWVYQHVDASLLIQTGQGALHTITICGGPTGDGVATVYDGVDNTGTVIAPLDISMANSVSIQPITLHFDCGFTVGLYIEYGQGLVVDLSVSYV